MSAISKCIDLAAFGDGETHDELAEQARLDYRALHTELAQLRMNFNDAIMRLHEMMQDTPVHNQGYEAYQNAVAFLARMKETK